MDSISLDTLTCRIGDGLAEVTLTQGKRGNPIDGPFCADMNRLSVDLATRADIRAVLIRAEGRFFSVGGDIRSFIADRDALPSIVLGWTSDLHMAIARMQRMDAPVVCAVHGDAAGGAVSLIAMADVVFAAEGVQFSAAFSMIGFCADSGSTVSLSNRMGLARAKRFLMLSETLDAAQAGAAGLVDFVLPPDDLAAAAEKQARSLATGPTLAYGAIRRSILSARTETLEAQLEHEAQALARLAATDDAWEGLTAFAERRKPAFRGR
ncbi:enoyl-CoA hydratase/isomerase family protein [Paracoccus sp. (in: a-proteobacteria)]|uniref:enoyl-CoA hydratase/isomerase family protein n=1 Tax=Paracoccus sp. TaxID=267 RepID=UPI003A83543D